MPYTFSKYVSLANIALFTFLAISEQCGRQSKTQNFVKSRK